MALFYLESIVLLQAALGCSISYYSRQGGCKLWGVFIDRGVRVFGVVGGGLSCWPSESRAANQRY